VRTSPGRYTLRTLAANAAAERSTQAQPMAALGTRKPAAAAPTSQPRARTDSDVGGGFAS